MLDGDLTEILRNIKGAHSYNHHFLLLIVYSHFPPMAGLARNSSTKYSNLIELGYQITSLKEKNCIQPKSFSVGL